MKPFESTPALIDMAPTLMAALEAPTAGKASGRVLHEIGGSEAQAHRARGGRDALERQRPDSRDRPPTVSDTEADEMEEHLRGLGYIE